MTRQKPKKSKKPAQKRKSAKRASGGHIARPGEILPVKTNNIQDLNEASILEVIHAVREPITDWRTERPILTRCLPWLIFAAVIAAGLIGHFAK